MIDVVDITEYNLWFRSDIGNLYPDLKPRFSDYHHTYYSIFWVPISKYALKKLLSYEYNEKLGLALQNIESKELQAKLQARSNQNDLLNAYQKLNIARIQQGHHWINCQNKLDNIATVCNALMNAQRAIIFIEMKDVMHWIWYFKKYANRNDVYIITKKMEEHERCVFVSNLTRRQDNFIILMNAHLLPATSCLTALEYFDYIVIDEGRWLSNPNTKVAENMAWLRNKANKVCILSSAATKDNTTKTLEILKLMHGKKHFANANFYPYFFTEIKSYSSTSPTYGKLLPWRQQEWDSFLDLYKCDVLINK